MHNFNLILNPASISHPLVGKRTRVLKARLDNKAEIYLLLSSSMDFYAKSTSRYNWSNVQTTCLLLNYNFTCQREQDTSGLKFAR